LNHTKPEISHLWFRVCESSDSAAFESLFHLYYPRLLRFSVLYLTNKEPAEEVVSDVFTNVWLSRKNLQHIGNPEVYLFVAVKNRSLNYLKQFSRHHMVSLGAGDAEMLLSALCPEKETEQRELREKMMKPLLPCPVNASWCSA